MARRKGTTITASNGKAYAYQTVKKKVGMKIDPKTGATLPDYKTFYGKTKKEALEKFNVYMEKRNGSPLDSDAPFGQFVAWYEKSVYALDDSISAPTRTLHINSYHKIFDSDDILLRPLNMVTGTDLQTVLSASGCGGTTKRHARSFLRRFFGYVDGERIVSDVTKQLVIPQAQKRRNDQDIEVFTEDELKELLYKTPTTHRLRLLVVLGIRTGARIGELLALEYSDLENGEMRISKSVKELDPTVDQRGEVKTKVIVGETKTTESIRTLPLSEELQEEIRRHKRWHTEEMLRKGYRTSYVFTSQNGTLLYPSNVRTAFARLCRTVGVTPHSFHCLRHSFATRLSANGVPLATLQKLLGHSDSSITSRYYVNKDAEQKAEALAAMNL